MSPKLPRILFVCVGNSCRSQMAEGFAHTYGRDVMIPASAGIAPALSVSRDTIHAMAEKNIDLHDHFPKSLDQLNNINFDLIVNISGFDLPNGLEAPVVDWKVRDPIGCTYEVQCEVRDQIEKLVMELILILRRDRKNHGATGSPR